MQKSIIISLLFIFNACEFGELKYNELTDEVETVANTTQDDVDLKAVANATQEVVVKEKQHYTRDNTTNIVTDITTNLQWQDNEVVKKRWLTQENYANEEYFNTSGDTATTYCQNLTLGGFTNWRLPTKKELEGIVLNSVGSPTIDIVYFKNTESSYYWSSTTYADYSSYAWFVPFGYGYLSDFIRVITVMFVVYVSPRQS